MPEETNAVIIDDGAALVVRSNEELPEKHPEDFTKNHMHSCMQRK